MSMGKLIYGDEAMNVVSNNIRPIGYKEFVLMDEEQSKRLVESSERLSQAWRNMGQTADAICESMEKLHETTGKKDGEQK